MGSAGADPPTAETCCLDGGISTQIVVMGDLPPIDIK
jgi:hypothetical protein